MSTTWAEWESHQLKRVCRLAIWEGALFTQTRKLALVIGNSNYAANLALENPVNDAVAIGRALEALRYRSP